MKKIIIGIIALVYLAVSSGVVMEIHYCMGKIAAVDLYASTDDHCGKCGMKEKKGGCCNDEVKVYKLADSHNIAVNNIIFETTDLAVLPIYAEHAVVQPLQTISINLRNYSPPVVTMPSLCVLNCTFLI